MTFYLSLSLSFILPGQQNYKIGSHLRKEQKLLVQIRITSHHIYIYTLFFVIFNNNDDNDNGDNDVCSFIGIKFKKNVEKNEKNLNLNAFLFILLISGSK